MALRHSVRNYLFHQFEAETILRRSFTSRDCGQNPDPPACPPCKSPSAPPCRNKVPRNQYELHVFCRSPPGGRSPPCPCPEPSRVRDCTNSVADKSNYQKLKMGKKRCDGIRDIVQKKHSEAKEKRRQSYLEDVDKRKQEVKCANESERNRHLEEANKNKQQHKQKESKENSSPSSDDAFWASDGHAYHQNTSSCIPPPKLIPLTNNPDRCSPRTDRYLKPCTDLPSPLLTIIRKVPESKVTKYNVEVSNVETRETLSSRLMKKLLDKKETKEASSQPQEKQMNNSELCEDSIDQKIADHNMKNNSMKINSNQMNSKSPNSNERSRCNNSSYNSEYTPKCVKPSLVDRITKGISSPGEQTKRKFHTHAYNSALQKRSNDLIDPKCRTFVGHVQIKVSPIKENRSEIQLFMSFDNDIFQQDGVDFKKRFPKENNKNYSKIKFLYNLTSKINCDYPKSTKRNHSLPNLNSIKNTNNPESKICKTNQNETHITSSLNQLKSNFSNKICQNLNDKIKNNDSQKPSNICTKTGEKEKNEKSVWNPFSRQSLYRRKASENSIKKAKCNKDMKIEANKEVTKKPCKEVVAKKNDKIQPCQNMKTDEKIVKPKETTIKTPSKQSKDVNCKEIIQKNFCSSGTASVKTETTKGSTTNNTKRT